MRALGLKFGGPAVLVATALACAAARTGLSPDAGANTVTSPASDAPSLPDTLYAYSDAHSPLPDHFLNGPPGARGGRGGRGGPPPGRGAFVAGGFPPPPPGGPPPGRGGRGGPGRGGPVVTTDRTPTDNAITDAGATLGRVLFCDKRLSANNSVACASCHQQRFGFSDTAQLSTGLHGEKTARHAMSLGNARFYRDGRYFWDERAASLEAQVVQPIQNSVEMGMSLDSLVPKLQRTAYYPALFTRAFGTPEVNSDRISRALAQFVRSLGSSHSSYDKAFGTAPPNFNLLTPQQQLGERIFNGRGACARCHGTPAQILDAPHNTGLDATVTDSGAGRGRFKAPSLRNVAVRAPYMHDGRFKALREVVDFYDHGVKDSPNLDQRMRSPDGRVRRLDLSPGERDALVAFLESLTDKSFLTDVRFSNPFPARN